MFSAPLGFGPGGAFIAAAAVTPGAMVILAFVLERRWLRIREQYRSFIIGDVALAGSVASFVACLPTDYQSHAGVLPSLLALGWLTFGLWQWLTEVRNLAYTKEQALSPTKIWHQIVVYPTVGTWLILAVIKSAPYWSEHLFLTALGLAGFALWSALAVYDSRHTQLGHIPYDWKTLRPSAPPWGSESRTLAVHEKREGQTTCEPPGKY